MATPVRVAFIGSLVQVSFGTWLSQFFFRPDGQMRQDFLYVLGRLAEDYNIELHAAVLMSNHVHLLFTDRGETRAEERERRIKKRPIRKSEPEPVNPEGQMPVRDAFLQALTSWLSGRVRIRHGVEGPVRGKERISIQMVETEASTIHSLAYFRSNSVTANMVAKPTQYPAMWGFAMHGSDERIELTIPKPDRFGRRQPKEVNLLFTKPPKVEHLKTGELVQAVQHETGRIIREHRAEHGVKKPLGMRQVVKQDIRTRAKTKKTNKTLYVKANCPKTYAKAMERVREFLALYHSASARLRAGYTDVEFPAGTEYAVRYQGGRVALCGANVA